MIYKNQYFQADYENTRYELMLTHVANVDDQHETYIEYKYNSTGIYSLSNHLDIPKKELTLELHLDK